MTSPIAAPEQTAIATPASTMPIPTPEPTSSEPTSSIMFESQPQGPPSTCPSESSQPQPLSMDSQPNGPAIQKKRKERDPSMVECEKRFYATMSQNLPLQELWFHSMRCPIPGYPDIKPPPRTSLTLRPVEVDKPKYPRRYVRRGSKIVYAPATATPTAPKVKKFKLVTDHYYTGPNPFRIQD